MQASTAYVLFYKKRLKLTFEQALAKDHNCLPAPYHDSAGSSVDVGSCVDVDKHTNGELSCQGSTDTSVTQRYNLPLQNSKGTMSISPSQSSCEIEGGVRSGLDLDNIPTESAVKQTMTSSHSRSVCDVESHIDLHLDNIQTGVRKSKFVWWPPS